MMNVYPVRVTMDDEEVCILLKLDVKHIRSLQAKAGKTIFDIITDAPTDPGIMADLLNAAMRYKNSDNPINLDGDDLYDLLVEQGKGGMADWMEIANGIAVVSGVLQKEQASAMLTAVRERMNKAIRQMDQGEGEDPSAKREDSTPPKI